MCLAELSIKTGGNRMDHARQKCTHDRSLIIVIFFYSSNIVSDVHARFWIKHHLTKTQHRHPSEYDSCFSFASANKRDDVQIVATRKHCLTLKIQQEFDLW